MKDTRDILVPLGCFPAFGKATTPCKRCEERATSAATWLYRGEVIVLSFCDEHALDAEEWLDCNAVWLTGKSALRVGEGQPQVTVKRSDDDHAEETDRGSEAGVQLLLALGGL